MAYSPGPIATQFSGIQGSPTELSVEVSILKADNLPHMKRWIRTRRRFYVTITYQGHKSKLASARFDGYTAKWFKKFDTFFLPPSSPFTLHLYAKRFLSADILVGKTQVTLPPAGTSEPSFVLKEGDKQVTPPVVLYLRVTVRVNPTSTPVLPAGSTDPIASDPTSLQPSHQPYQPYRAERETHSNPYPQHDQPYPVNAIPDRNFLTSGPPNFRNAPSGSTFPTPPAANEASSSRWPSNPNPNPTDRFAPDPRSSPRRYSPNPTDSNGASSSGRPTRSPDPSPRPGQRLPAPARPNPMPPNAIAGPSSNPFVARDTTLAPSVPPKPISATPSTRSGINVPPPHPVAANVTPTPSFSNKPTDPIPSSSRARQSDPLASVIPDFEPDIDDIIQTVQRFRILSVGRSGVGKSSLINHVFGIDAAQVQNHRPGEANIQQEFVSPQNQYFVLHDSEGFEPGDLSNYETVSNFVRERSRQSLPLSERVHGLWLCTETPTAGGRVFETGDEKLLQFAHKHQVPMVIVFTQYDRLVRSKRAELLEEYPQMDEKSLRTSSLEDAQEAFNICLKSLKRTMDRLRIPMPRYARVSVRPGHKEDIAELVAVTRDVVLERVKGDAWVLWAIAQRQSLPVKIDACITKGINRNYRRALMGVAPGAGKTLLQHCLRKMHKDIITCWNFKGEVHKSREFQELMLCLVQDVHTKPGISTLPAVDVINQYVTLATATAAPIAPPVAVLGLTFTFVQWLSITALDNAAAVQRLLIAYTVDLIRVLKELFDITLRPELALTTTWTELQAAFEAYEQSQARQRIHSSICTRMPQGELALTADDICKKVRELLRD